jgi:hypothetical protein
LSYFISFKNAVNCDTSISINREALFNVTSSFHKTTNVHACFSAIPQQHFFDETICHPFKGVPMNFTKQSFARFMAQRYHFSLDEGERLYSAIGSMLTQTLLDGDIAKLFGVGALKRTQRYEDGPHRIRFRPSPAISEQLQQRDPKESAGPNTDGSTPSST